MGPPLPAQTVLGLPAAVLLACPAVCPLRVIDLRLRSPCHLANKQFVLLVHDVVAEKEGRARQMMATMGLRCVYKSQCRGKWKCLRKHSSLLTTQGGYGGACDGRWHGAAHFSPPGWAVRRCACPWQSRMLCGWPHA